MCTTPTTPHEQRDALRPYAEDIFALVIRHASSKQWCDWLRPPLEHAATSGDLNLVAKLLTAGANGGAGVRGCRGRTLLDAAAEGGNSRIVSALLRAGAHVDINTRSGSKRRSALHRAAFLGHDDVSRVLLLAGAEVGLLDAEKRTPLHLAVREGHQRVVCNLLLGGACPNAKDRKRDTPVHLAAALGHEQILGSLLLNGADKNSLDALGRSALHLAAERGHVAVVETLLAAGADVNHIRYSNSEISVLDSAASHGNVDILRALLPTASHGNDSGGLADVNAIDSTGYTALHMAADNNQVAAIEVLVQAGADVEAQDQHHWTPLHCAARYNCCQDAISALLVKHGANVNARDTAGESPLHIACAYLAPGAADLLLRCGADETARNGDGHTASEVIGIYVDDASVAEHTRDETIELLRRLVDRAPQDRAWRRRRTLVLYRSVCKRWDGFVECRACCGCHATCSEQKNTVDSNCDSNSRQHHNKLTKIEQGRRRPVFGESEQGRRRGALGDSSEDGREGVDGGPPQGVVDTAVAVRVVGCGGCSNGVVTKVVGLREEGIFRTIALFL